MATGDDAALPSPPDADAVRSLSAANGRPEAESRPDEPGTVVWHRKDLRIADNPAVAAAADEADRIFPLFVFDPDFHDERGAACDARIEFLHDCLRDPDRAYRDVGGAGVTYSHGDPLAALGRFVDAGWDVVASPSPTGRYGRRARRDERPFTHLRFGCLPVREVHRHVDEHAPDSRGKSMFVSRLFWNRHYTQKLLDWPG